MKQFKSEISFFKTRNSAFWFLAVSIFCLLNVYLFNRYDIAPVSVERIRIETNVDKDKLLIYTNSEHDFEIDFTKPITAKRDGNFVVFDISSLKFRSFRIYIGENKDSAFIKNITLYSDKYRRTLGLSEFELNDIQKLPLSSPTITWFKSAPTAYFELKSERIEMLEFYLAEFLIIILACSLSLLVLMNLTKVQIGPITFLRIKVISVYVFLFSIFLPLPIFNIAFMLSFLLVIRDFNYQRVLTSKVAMLFLLYFIFFMLNNWFVSYNYNPKITETLLPVFFLPFYFACVPKVNYLRAFPIAGFLISLYFLATASIDMLFYHNLNTFSFDAFSKYIHPVYFSYLLFFSLLYLEIREAAKFRKLLVFGILLIALVCCGSKLIIALIVGFYGLKYLKKSRVTGFAGMGLLIIAVLLFPPTRTRFVEILSMENLSILADNPIKSEKDVRLNGLTLRLIIWQESFRALEDSGDFLFGKGVDKKADKVLENRLLARGLAVGQTKYDPHNQLITTLYKLGVIGLAILLMICFYVYKWAIRSKDQFMLFCVILFSAAMLTESILQRAVGIYFFISILLLLSAPITTLSKKVENSNSRNQGDSQ